MDVGFSGAGSDFFYGAEAITSAGSPTYTIVETPFDTLGISITGRGGSYHAVDLLFDGVGANWQGGGIYQIVVTGRNLDPFAEPQFIVGGADNPWNWLHNAQAGSDFVFEVRGEISVGAFSATDGGTGQFAERNRVRLQTNDTTAFIIDEIIISRTGEGSVLGAAGEPALGGNWQALVDGGYLVFGEFGDVTYSVDADGITVTTSDSAHGIGINVNQLRGLGGEVTIYFELVGNFPDGISPNHFHIRNQGNLDPGTGARAADAETGVLSLGGWADHGDVLHLLTANWYNAPDVERTWRIVGLTIG
jgi:hypothetical protein